MLTEENGEKRWKRGFAVNTIKKGVPPIAGIPMKPLGTFYTCFYTTVS
jgi:hypothetical protein